MNLEEQQADIIICGAGLAGLMLAACLPESLSIIVLEARSLPKPVEAQQTQQEKVSINDFDARVSAMTAASRELFEALGLWQNIIRKQDYQHMSVWDAEGTAEIAFDAAMVQKPELGFIVENRCLMQVLIDYLRYRKNIKLLSESPVATIQLEQSRAAVQLESGEQLTASLLVGADGANSMVRNRLDFRTREWDYGQHAIVCTVETEKPHANTAWQRFLSTGPLAFLPLAAEESRYSSIVWSVDEDLAPRLMADDDQVFRQKLAFAFENRLGDIKVCSRRFSFPLRQRHAVDYVKPNVALIGDAAHTIHPLAGQGINLGFQDAKVLAEEIERAIEKNVSPGNIDVLKRYQRRRKPDNLRMMALMEAFKQLFGREELPVRLLRNLGMNELNKHPLAKRKLVQQAMGL